MDTLEPTEPLRKESPVLSQAPKRRFLNGPFITTALIAGLLLAAIAAFKLIAQPMLIKGFLAKNVPPPATVTAIPARTEQWVTRLPSVGSLTAIQGIDVAPQVAGVVTKITFDSGMDVAKDAELVDLDTSVEEADLANNQATLKQLDLDLARQNDLQRRAIASEATQQAAQAKRDSAAANVARSKALIAQKHIVAPFAGRVGIRKVDLGQYVAVGAPMASLIQLDPMRVDFPVPETELARLKVGQQIEVTVDAYPGQTFKGSIKSLDARLATDSRTLLVRGEVPNPDKKLLPNMFAKIDVVIGDPHDVVTLPRTAITYSLYGDSVYVVVPPKSDAETTPDGTPPPSTAERRFVRVSETRQDQVAISEGVANGDVVVTTGQLKLQNGARIRVNNDQSLQPPAVRPKY